MTKLERRDVIKLTAGVGMALGLGKLASAREGGLYQRIMEQAKLGDLAGVAQAASGGSKYTVVHLVLIDKTQTALFQHIPNGTVPPGGDAGEGAATILQEFRGMPLTKLFAQGLDGLPANVSLTMNNAFASGAGGHNLTNSYVSDALGGFNAAVEARSGGTGLLGAVGFSLRASANDSRDLFVGPGRRQLTTYSSVSDLHTTIRESLLPLSDDKTLEMVRYLDKLVSPKFEMRDRLVALAGQIQSILPELDAAGKLTMTMPAMGNNNNNQAARADVIMQQVKAVIALSKAGVARNFMIAVPWNDTNGGNSLTAAGGGSQMDPFSATPRIAAALVELHKNIPDLFVVSTSDGGRSPNNGDQSAGLAFMTGPDSILKNGYLGEMYGNFSELNQAKGTVTMSDGTQGVASPAIWYNTVLKAMGYEVDGKYVSQALVG
jgi:hypothetical protein